MVVEDMSCFDTNAIILKGTTVLTYKPKLLDRPFSGSLFGIEVRRNKFALVKHLKLEELVKTKEQSVFHICASRNSGVKLSSKGNIWLHIRISFPELTA